MTALYSIVPEFRSLDLLQDYWQMPLEEKDKAQDWFTITLPCGLCTPIRVAQGMLNATVCFQLTMAKEVAGDTSGDVNGTVDGLIIWGKTR